MKVVTEHMAGLVGDRSINLTILQENMVVLANDLPCHMLVSVCSLSTNLNVHTKPEKIRPS